MRIDDGGIRRFARHGATGAGLLLFGVWLLVLRPQVLGGPAAYITVTGVSMEPTLHAGDLVVMSRADEYRPGDVVAYRVPHGDPAAGRHVIHRVIGGGPHEGYLLQGDNTPAPDRWRPSTGDIVGKQLLVVPAFGSILMLLKQPAAIAGLATAILVFTLPDWSATGGAEVQSRQRLARTLGGLVDRRSLRHTVVASNHAILVDERSRKGETPAQVLVEFRNVGADWVEMNAAMSTYTIAAEDGAVVAQGCFTSVGPRRLSPGATGYMLADVGYPDLSADQVIGLSTVMACRDARPWAPGETHRSPWRLVPG